MRKCLSFIIIDANAPIVPFTASFNLIIIHECSKKLLKMKYCKKFFLTPSRSVVSQCGKRTRLGTVGVNSLITIGM